FEVTAVSKEGILEAGGFTDGQVATRAFSANPELMHREMWDFAPYLLSFEAPSTGKSWPGLPPQGGVCVSASIVCRFDGKVAGTEKVTTPGGTFDAIKVVVEVNVAGMGFGWRQMAFWYADAV